MAQTPASRMSATSSMSSMSSLTDAGRSPSRRKTTDHERAPA